METTNNGDLIVLDAHQPTIRPALQISEAGEAAAACKSIVAATAVTIQGRKYVRVEGWQAIAIAHGCIASSRSTERVEGGVRAIGEIRRRDTGAVIAEAEGFVGDDESTWAKRPEFARRAMASTRAISRVCRSAFAHVVVMMNAGLETTPAEEMEGMPPVAHAAPIQQPQRRSQPQPAESIGDVISTPQQKRMYAVYKGANHSDASVKDWLFALYGIEHSRDIKRSDYDAICKRLQDVTPLTADLEREVGAEG